MWVSFFIVWRESVEALLVIGILYAWVKREKKARELNQIWLGAGLGLLLATGLALIIHYAGSWYAGSGGEWFLAMMMLAAALLILHMVIWMRRHGHSMKHELEREAAAKLANGNGFGLMILVALAVGREGSETVVFLTGTIQQASSLSFFIIGALLGLVGALITFVLMQVFSHFMPWKWFFRVSAIILLLLGGALLIGASDKIVGQLAGWDNLPDWAFAIMYDPLWDTSWLLADSKGTWAGLIGYYATPTLSQYVPLALYWLCACLFFIAGNGSLPRRQSLKT